MLKHNLIYLILSIIVVIFASYIHLITVYIDMLFVYANYHLAPFFNNTPVEIALRKALVLVIIPLICVGVPALIYRLIKKQNMPHFIPAIWILWTFMVLSDVLIR